MRAIVKTYFAIARRRHAKVPYLRWELQARCSHTKFRTNVADHLSLTKEGGFALLSSIDQEGVGTVRGGFRRALPFRLRLFLSHLFLSAGIVSALAAVVLLIWYPRPLFGLQGAPFILLMIVFVDVIIGPMLTLIVASPRKLRRELIRDLTIIGTVQLAALAYGAHSLFVARPAFVVFNTDRFDVVVANELVEDPELPYRDSRFTTAPVLGPVWVAAHPPESAEKRTRMLFSTVTQGGPDIKDLPALYEPWPPERGIDTGRLKPLSELMATSSEGNDASVNAMRIFGLREDGLAYVPLVGRERTGVVILNRQTLAVVYASDAAPKY